MTDVLYFSTRAKGHYRYYYDLIREEYEVNWVRSFAELVRKIRYSRIVFFAHGDSTLVFALMLLVFARKFRILLYYSLSDSNWSLRDYIKFIILKVLSLFGARIFTLEYDMKPAGLQSLKIFDPVVPYHFDDNRIFENRIGCFGYIDCRKNVVELVELVHRLNSYHGGCYDIYISGEGDFEYIREIRDLAKSLGVSIKINEGYLSEADLCKQVGYCEIIWARYKDHVGSSGQFLRSLLSNKKLVYSSTTVPIPVFKEFQLDPYYFDERIDEKILAINNNFLISDERIRELLNVRSPKIWARTLLD